MLKRELKLLEAIAHHEAGHAVVAIRNNLTFGSVTIKPDADGRLVLLGHKRTF